MTTLPYREQLLLVREDAIVQAVNRLLATKGYDLMTVDEVASEAGMAKASLYKHFSSKEALAGAAMVRILDRAIAQADAQEQRHPDASGIDQLRAMVRWTLEVQLAGEMPTLPAQNTRLTDSLRASRQYTDRLIALSDRLGEWILQAQANGSLANGLPSELVLYTLFARACDPVLGLMKATGQYTDAQLIDWLVTTTFDGLAQRPTASLRKQRGAVLQRRA